MREALGFGSALRRGLNRIPDWAIGMLGRYDMVD